jgi:Rad3-related DNA helicase
MPLVRLLLCSPAGKTLALLCATLAWQQQQAHLAPQQPDAPAPRVFWAARTHAQIDHAVHEVRYVFHHFSSM